MGCMQSHAQSETPLDRFVASLANETPPIDLTGALLGVWWALRGAWQNAHDAVQNHSPECSWVHAALHREEGDHSNADYWYRLAGRPVAHDDPRTEYLAIASELLSL